MRICRVCLLPEGAKVKFSGHSRKVCNRCRGRDYYERNQEKARTAAHAYYHANKKEIRARVVAKYKANPDIRWNRELRYRYGISLKDYDAMCAAQSNRCAICGNLPKKRLSIDHCHASNHLRGLLCGNCNTGLGMFKDDPVVMEKAIAYLRA